MGNLQFKRNDRVQEWGRRSLTAGRLSCTNTLLALLNILLDCGSTFRKLCLQRWAAVFKMAVWTNRMSVGGTILTIVRIDNRTWWGHHSSRHDWTNLLRIIDATWLKLFYTSGAFGLFFLSKDTFVHLSLGTELAHDNLSSKCDCRIMGNTLLSTAVCCLFTNPCSPFEIWFHCALMQATWHSWLWYHVDKECLFILGCCKLI